VEAKTISELKVGDQFINDQKGISHACADFYRTLLSREPIDQQAWALITKDLPKLSPEEKLTCEGTLTFNEMFRSN
jgi:hypothetical protein